MPPLVSFKISDHDSIGITILVTKVYLVWEGDREWEVSLEEGHQQLERKEESGQER